MAPRRLGRGTVPSEDLDRISMGALRVRACVPPGTVTVRTPNGFQARPLPHVVWREYVKPHISGGKGMAHACHGIVHQLKAIANQRLAHYGHATCNKTDVDKDISIEAGSNRLAAESPTVDGDHMSANQSPGAGGFLECQRRAIFSNSL